MSIAAVRMNYPIKMQERETMQVSTAIKHEYFATPFRNEQRELIRVNINLLLLLCTRLSVCMYLLDVGCAQCAASLQLILSERVVAYVYYYYFLLF